jgi:hypothetical protein
MKKVILTLIFVLMSSLIFSQVVYFGFGYNVASGSFKNFNYVIDRYNETRVE